jgi:hypothetical protein
MIETDGAERPEARIGGEVFHRSGQEGPQGQRWHDPAVVAVDRPAQIIVEDDVKDQRIVVGIQMVGMGEPARGPEM